jgi:conjugative transposon TraM protein
MSTNNQTEDGKPKLSNEQKQKLKKYAVFALMGIICAGSIWLIFAPSADEKAKQEQTAGFNADIPLPKEEGIIDNKKDAYEQEQMKRKQEERMRSLSDFSAMLGGDSETQMQTPQDDLVLLDSEPQVVKTSGGGTKNRPQSSIQQSRKPITTSTARLAVSTRNPAKTPKRKP